MHTMTSKLVSPHLMYSVILPPVYPSRNQKDHKKSRTLESRVRLLLRF